MYFPLPEFKYALDTGHCTLSEFSRAKFVINSNFTIFSGGKLKPLLRFSKASFLIGPSGWVIRKDVDKVLKDYVDHLFMIFRSNGFIFKAARLYSPDVIALKQNKKYLAKARDPNAIKSLEFESLLGIFYFLGAGLLVSFLAFIVELLIFSLIQIRKMKKKNKKSKKKWVSK